MKKWLGENLRFIVFLVLFGVFRTAVADWNPIPSGSMRPTLLEGDVVFVDRLAFDVKLPLTDVSVARVGEPRRGDIVTFFSPKDGTRLIKRIVGLPGDRIEMRQNRLTINGRAADYAIVDVVAETPGMERAVHAEETLAGVPHEIQWLPDRLSMNGFGPLLIPADQYLMLGDNRDNSEDSRYFGLVPRRQLIGRAVRVLVSADIRNGWGLRLDRFGERLQ